MYVQKSKLQHAADAAVLAGGYTYVADWDDPDKRTQVLNSMKKYLNSDIDNGQIEKVVYRFKDNDEAQGVMISLYAPHGEVWLTGNKPVVGPVVGNAICVTQNGVSIIWKDWEHAGGGGGGGTGSPSFVRLTEDVDDRYVVQP